MSDSLVRVAGLAAGYGGAPVFDDVTFELDRGERIGVLGPNGGGKSTLFRVLLGDLSPLRGSIESAAASASCRKQSAPGSTIRSARSTWR